MRCQHGPNIYQIVSTDRWKSQYKRRCDGNIRKSPTRFARDFVATLAAT